MEKPVTASARVQVTVEVEASSWGGDCSIDQLYRQAGEDGKNRVIKALSVGNCQCKIIGEPKVIGVLTERQY